MKYMCEPCGYIYDPAEGDPDGGIAPGTAFEDIRRWQRRLRSLRRLIHFAYLMSVSKGMSAFRETE